MTAYIFILATESLFPSILYQNPSDYDYRVRETGQCCVLSTIQKPDSFYCTPTVEARDSLFG